jgi:hypothetical protein
MSNEPPNDMDSTMFAAVFSENWQNARHIKTERISFRTTFSLITAGVRLCGAAPCFKSYYSYSCACSHCSIYLQACA